MRVPYIMVDRMPRPWSSVPSGNDASPPDKKAGGLKLSSRLRLARSNGLCGASQGENTAPSTQISTTAAETMATGARRKL
jgi:hypothetical protein